MSLDPKSRARFNLSKTVVLLLDPTELGLDILAQILAGFGVRKIHRCLTVEAAKQVAMEHQIDLMLIDAISDTGEGYEFVRWLRREVPDPNRHTPVLLTAAHTRASDVANARDCGSHFILAKPLAPIVVLERVIWVAKEGRAFLLSDNYVGPDRRFARVDEDGDHPRRRHDDKPRKSDAPADEASGADERPVSFIDRPLKAAS
jgi:CheY-like chemotaxis protein